MDLNNEGPEADPMDLDKEGRGFSYVHDLEWHLGVSPMKALAPAEPDQCQPASLVNEYAGHHWTGAMAGDARVGGREAGAETFRCACRAVPAKRVAKRVARTQQLVLTFCCPYEHEHTFLAARGD